MLYFAYLGISIDVLKVLFDFVNEKVNNLYIWKGVKWARLKGVQNRHLKVITVLLCGQVLNLVIPFSTRLTRAIIPVDG